MVSALDQSEAARLASSATYRQPNEDDLREFEARLVESRARELRAMPPERFVGDRRVVWAPQAGSQESFIACPLFEVLYHGTRGPGKSDALLMAYAQHVGRGFGAAWRGVIFRETYPQLADVVAKSEKWFRQIFPGARFNKSKMQWEFATGEVLMFRHMRTESDYWSYHGHEYPFIGWEELTNWAIDRCYKAMFSCCRSSTPGVPRMVRSTTNPYGVGHSWVKERFRLFAEWWKTLVILNSYDERGNLEPPRASIHGHIDENKILLAADPDYKATISASASNPSMASAWLDGSWNLVAGGIISEVWSSAYNVRPRFVVPSSWRITRAFDWGSSRPFSVGWYAISDGSDFALPNGRIAATIRGDTFRVREWYGWSGKANEGLKMNAAKIAEGIVERELSWGWMVDGRSRVRPGPADASIFDSEDGNCIADNMRQRVRIGSKFYPGVEWTPSIKSPGSRKNGWQVLRQMIEAGQPVDRLPRERPGFFVVGEECPQFLRTMLNLVRSEKDLDDIDTNSEDHIADEVRYLVLSLTQGRSGSTTTTGVF